MSDTFCILPFLHINAYPDKKLKVCCYSQTFLENTNLENDSISDAFNSDEYKQIRLDMLNGEKPKFCDVCYKMDEEGAESYRTKWNNYYSHLIQKYKNKTRKDGYNYPDFVRLDLRPSNICNFKCRSCTSEYSSTWIEEQTAFKKFMGIAIDSNKNEINITNFDIDKRYLKNLEHIYFAGGEPLYMKEMYEFLSNLDNKDKIEIHLNTNFTIVKFNNRDIFEFFSQFKSINFGISCDGIGHVGEFVRTGFDTNNFINNMNLLNEAKTKYGNIKHVFQYTCSILNCFDFPNFRKSMYHMGYIDSDSQIRFGFVEHPYWLNVSNFEEKIEIIDLYNRLDKTFNYHDLKTEIKNFVIYLKTNTNHPKNSKEMFKTYINFGNKFNKVNIPNELEYLKKYL